LGLLKIFLIKKKKEKHFLCTPFFIHVHGLLSLEEVVYYIRNLQ
jgi:hypothetical protein